MKAEDRPEEELGHVPQFLLELKKKNLTKLLPLSGCSNSLQTHVA